MGKTVSIVVACYNKEAYADAMLRSIHRQSWDDIELVLVNDGSTDKTPQILKSWVPKMEARGYTVIIINQQNTGVRGAFNAGLAAMTGDYFCSLDADDTIDPEYVQTLAGFLQQNPEYEWSSCGYHVWDADTGRLNHTGVPMEPPGGPRFLENYLLSRTYGFTWIYMVRASYMKRCQVAEHFATQRNAIHEQELALPLLAARGKHRHINKPLYNYYLATGGLSQSADYQKKSLFFEDWARCCKISLSKLPMDEAERQRLETLVDAGLLIRQWQAKDEFTGASAKASRYIEALCQLMERVFPAAGQPPLWPLPPDHEIFLVRAVQELLVGNIPAYAGQTPGRVVAWGALGKAGRHKLATLAQLGILPTILWDAAAQGQPLLGQTVETPRPETLASTDILLILPGNPQAADSIRAQMEKAGSRPFLVEPGVPFFQFQLYSLFPGLYRAAYPARQNSPVGETP